MRKQTEYALDIFEKALSRLREGVQGATDDLGRDGVIQRFEFTFELLWKMLRIVLEEEGIQSNTPRESLKAAFRIGLLDEEQVPLDMLEDRNKTSHIYDAKEAARIFERIEKDYLPELGKIFRRVCQKVGRPLNAA